MNQSTVCTFLVLLLDDCLYTLVQQYTYKNTLDSCKVFTQHYQLIDTCIINCHSFWFYGLITFQIRNGADIKAQAIDGSIPVHFAAIRGGVEVMQLLLDTIQSRNLKISQHLLESDHDGRTVLHKAVQGGTMEVINAN